MDSPSQVFKFENSNNIYACPSPSSDHSGSSSSSTSDGGYKLASSNPKKRAGRRKFKETRHPVYRGIRRRDGRNKWLCELRNNKSRLWLGTYPTAEMAARAHDVAALALRGKSACLNFADSVWRLPVPVSTSDSDIRKAAVEAAKAFRPQEDGGVESQEWVKDCSDAQSSSSWSSSSKVGDGRVKESEGLSNEQSGLFMDEEAIFFMPQLLVDLANGLLLPPPIFYDDESRNCSVTHDADIALWNY